MPNAPMNRRRRNSGWYCATFLKLGRWTLAEYNECVAKGPHPLPPARTVAEALSIDARLRKEEKRRARQR